MKIFRIHFIIAIVLLALLMPGSVSASSGGGIGAPASFTAGEILVKFHSTISPSEIALIHRQNGGQVKEVIPGIGVQVVTVPAGKALEKAKAYTVNPKVAYAEPNYLAQADVIPDDPYFSQQWGLTKIMSTEAWGITTGSAEVKIAVLDTGVAMTHPDLATKIVADVNFTTSASANDLYGHGTHVAGIAAASTNNNIGTAGLSYNSTIMNVKVLGDDGYGSYSWIAQGIIWAADNGAKVINMSLGGTSSSSTLESSINYAWSKGVVVVASAGNSGSSSLSYPAYYSKVIAVAATDSADKITSWSSYGDWVDVAAPGSSIYSTLINGAYGYKSGTSMASPFVSGLAALVFTRVTDTNGNKLLNDEVRAQIETTCDNIGATSINGGRINAYQAVQTSTTVANGSIAGMVKDSATEMPISGATVTDGTRSALTDASGYYIIDMLPVGNYTLTASATDYTDKSQPVSVVAGQTTNVVFALSAIGNEIPPPQPAQDIWVSSISLGMTGRNLRLSVKITGDTGIVVGAQVKAQITASDGRVWNFTGLTDSYGTVAFTISKPTSGTYLATVIDVTETDYVWNSSKGNNSTTYTIAAPTRPVKK
jgi:thermitase